MKAQQEQGKVAANLLSQCINAGLVSQTAEDAVVVHGSHGDRAFKAGEGV